MTNKTIIAGLVALTFVAGTIMTGNIANAEEDPRVDSFFDIFYGLDDAGERNTPDSFFDIFTDSETGERPDSFFDIFVDIGESTARIDSFFDVWTEISVEERLDDLDGPEGHVTVLKGKDTSQDGEIARIDTEIVALNLRVDEVVAPTDLTTSSYIKFDGIDGESQDHIAGWSDLLSFDQGQHKSDNGSTGESRRRGGAIVEDVTLSKELDKASPKIAEAVLTGKVFPKVEIELTTTYGEERVTYYRYELTNVLVSSYNISGGSGSVPIEDFSLNFEEIKVTYTEYDDKGTKGGNVEYNWKVEKGAK